MPARPIKVAQIVFTLEPGGMENGVVNLANCLTEHEAVTKVFCLEHAGAFAQRLKGSVEVVALGRRPGWDWQACRRLAAALREWGADVLHTHNLGPLIYMVAARAVTPALWRTPILHGEHGALQGDSLRPKRLLQRRWLYRACRRVHTVSDGLLQELVARGLPADRLVSVLNGVDCQRFQPAADKAEARQKAGLPPTARVLGTVGRFIATKRYPLLIEAFELLAARHADLHLLMLGDGGPERAAVLERAAASPVQDRIHARGHQAEPAPFYQAMDLLVMPSSHEGLANALLEAMASGVPALAHAACGAAEVIENGRSGFLDHIVTAAGLAERIEQLLAAPGQMAAAGQAARAAATARFSLESMVGNYLALYRKTVR
ncbi:MAG: glycosyltransferase [Prosthecobacter sp.]